MIAGPDWQGLQAAIGGEVVRGTAHDPVPATFNARFHDLRPQAVVRCTSAEDVAAALAFVQRHELPFVVRSGGHCFAGHSSTSGVVLDVTPMDQVRLDGGLVTVGAGARLGPVYDRLWDEGRALPAGTCPTVGIAGLALAGGLGILGRRYGLTADGMVAAEVVLADGRVVVCDDDHEPDLFWALRGAGAGNFGVVTSFVFRTVAAPRAVVFHLAWGFDQAASVVEAWQVWAPSAPDELAVSLKVTATGDPGEPPTVNVYAALQVDGADRRSHPDGPRGLDDLDDLVDRVGAAPTWRWSEDLDFAESRRFWAELPPPGTSFRDLGPAAAGTAGTGGAADEAHHPWLVAKSEFFRQPLPGDAVANMLATFADGRLPGEERELDFMPWAGAYNRVASDATAFVHRRELFLLKHAATVDPAAAPAAKDAAQTFVRRSWATTNPWGSGGVFQAFPDPDLTDPAGAYYGTNLPRLRRAKERYDPTGVFRVPDGQGVAP